MIGLQPLITEVACCRDDYDPTIDQFVALNTDRCLATRPIPYVVPHLQTEVGPMNTEKTQPFVQMADVLQSGNDGEFGLYL
jgi:hypothetical protein